MTVFNFVICLYLSRFVSYGQHFLLCFADRFEVFSDALFVSKIITKKIFQDKALCDIRGDQNSITCPTTSYTLISATFFRKISCGETFSCS